MPTDRQKSPKGATKRGRDYINIPGMERVEVEEFDDKFPTAEDLRRFARVMFRVLADPECPPAAELWAIEKGKEIAKAISEGRINEIPRTGWARLFWEKLTPEKEK